MRYVSLTKTTRKVGPKVYMLLGAGGLVEQAGFRSTNGCATHSRGRVSTKCPGLKAAEWEPARLLAFDSVSFQRGDAPCMP